MTANYSYYSIPAAWLLAISPHTYAISSYSLNSRSKFDNRSPRALPAKLAADQTLPQATKDRILRAEGASKNGFENLGLFAAAVAAGNVGGVDPAVLNALVVAYLGSRAVYNLVYINNSTGFLASVRSMLYMMGVGVVFALFGLAGRNVNSRL